MSFLFGCLVAVVVAVVVVVVFADCGKTQIFRFTDRWDASCHSSVSPVSWCHWLPDTCITAVFTYTMTQWLRDGMNLSLVLHNASTLAGAVFYEHWKLD